MESVEDAPASGAATKKRSLRTLASFLAVFAMIGTSFFVMVAAAVDEPWVDTNTSQYHAGETVYIDGGGFSGAVTITISQPELDLARGGPWIVVDWPVMLDGTFNYSGYVAEAVSNEAVPVTVHVTDGASEASCSFYEPGLKLELLGWTLHKAPAPKWTEGMVKGYFEGDIVPVRCFVEKPDGVTTRTIVIEVEKSSEPPLGRTIYGYDYLVDYHQDSPTGPFNIYNAPSPNPFYSAEASLAWSYLGEREYSNRYWDAWSIEVTFKPGASSAYVRFGAHLAITQGGILGASHFPGASLQIRETTGGQTPIQINPTQIFTPPSLQIEKTCWPQPAFYVAGQTITFEIKIWNTGEADALHVVLNDTIPSVVSYVASSSYISTDKGANWNSLPLYPKWTSGNQYSWYIGNILYGTRSPSYTPGDYVLVKFQVTIKSGADPGQYWNYANVWWTDDHAGLYPVRGDECSFWVVAPEVVVTKTSDKTCAAVDEHVIFEILLWNPSLLMVMHVEVTDLLVKSPGTLWVGDLSPDQHLTLTGYLSKDGMSGYVYIPELDYQIKGTEGDPFKNVVTVEAWDQYGHSVSRSAETKNIDVRHPDVTITKDVDKKCAAVGEDVTYTITVTNIGDCWLNFSISDPLLGGTLWDKNSPGYYPLEPTGVHKSKTISVTYNIKGTEDLDKNGLPDDPLINTASVTYWDDQWADDRWGTLHKITESDTSTVDVRHPALTVTKDARKTCAEEGEKVIFVITITNTGDIALDYTVDDPLLGGLIWGYGSGVVGGRHGETYTKLAKDDYIILTGNWDADLTSTDHVVYLAVLNYEVTGEEFGDPNKDNDGKDPFKNGVTVTYWDDQWVEGDQWASLHRFTTPLAETGEINILHPSIDVVKYAYNEDGKSIPDQVDGVMRLDYVTYEIEVKNPGILGHPLDTTMDFNVADSFLKPVGYIWATGMFGDKLFGPDKTPYQALGPGASVILTGDISKDTALGYGDGYVYLEILHYKTKLGDLSPITNVVTVNAWDYQNHERSDKDSKIVKLYDYASLIGWVFRDDDVDGVMDYVVSKGDKEPGLPKYYEDGEWSIVLSGMSIFDEPVTYSAWTTYTDLIRGYFGDEFDGIIEPSDAAGYTLQVTPPAGWKATTPEIWSNIVVTSGEIEGDDEGPYDFGYVKEQEITGYKWLDENMNGIKDGREVFLNGWHIILEGYESFGDYKYIWKETWTGPPLKDGYFSFKVYPGTYNVWEELLDGTWVCIKPTMIVGPDGEPGYPNVIINSPGGQIFCLKFGNVQYGVISGFKFYDWNENQVWDNGEDPIPSWTVYLDGTLLNGTVVHDETQTDQFGNWAFTDALPGVYTVTEDLPYGWHATTPVSVRGIEIYSGTMVEEIKFGNIPTTSIWGYKFLDKDLDGRMDAGEPGGEPGLSGWRIQLWYKACEADLEWTVVDTTVTDSTGLYEFRDIRVAGLYKVTEVLQPGWAMISSPMVPVNVLEMPLEPTKAQYDIGNVRYGKVEGWKFEDRLDVGVYRVMDPDEFGIGNWRIMIKGTLVNGMEVPTTPVWTKNMGCCPYCIGYYVFDDLLPGTYWLWEASKEGWTPTTPSGVMITIPVTVNEAAVTFRIDFGNMHPSDPELEFVLLKGTNLWSSPLKMSSPLYASRLAQPDMIGSKLIWIKKYDPVLKVYQTFKPGITPDFEIKPGTGYLIRVSEDAAFTLSGNLDSSMRVQLSDGKNLVGYNQLKPVMASEFVKYVSGPWVSSIKYLGDDGLYHTYKHLSGNVWIGEDFVVTQGRAYVLTLVGSGTIIYPG